MILVFICQAIIPLGPIDVTRIVACVQDGEIARIDDAVQNV